VAGIRRPGSPHLEAAPEHRRTSPSEAEPLVPGEIIWHCHSLTDATWATVISLHQSGEGPHSDDTPPRSTPVRQLHPAGLGRFRRPDTERVVDRTQPYSGTVTEWDHIERAESDRRVPLRIPPWIAGNDILGHLSQVAFKGWAIDASTFRWEVQTRERYEHRAPRLLTVDTVVAGGEESGQWTLLEGLTDPGVASTLSVAQILEERDRILAERPNNFAAMAAAIRLMVTMVPHGEIASATRGGFEALAALGLWRSAPTTASGAGCEVDQDGPGRHGSTGVRPCPHADRGRA
jgi:hypothetical protein